MDRTAWELLDEAVRRGYDIRIGFENPLRLRNSKSAQSIAELVREGRTLVESLGLEKGHKTDGAVSQEHRNGR
jgi:uncharacterized protein (DUF849 family)